MTIGQARIDIRHQLQDISDAADLDADRLLLHVFNTEDSSYLSISSTHLLSAIQEKNISELVQRRLNGEPLAYILGEAHFYGRPFYVSRDVLIPRSTTEDLVEKALALLPSFQKNLGRPIRIADIGTGSGCIAVTLCLEGSASIDQVFAIDISLPALDVARQNAERYGLTDKITFLSGNMLTPLVNQSVDLIVSNPPYVPTHELSKPPTTDTKGLRFEPQEALDGGVDGLTYVRHIEASGIPAIVETLEGHIATFSL